jgi:hypothetical protein
MAGSIHLGEAQPEFKSTGMDTFAPMAERKGMACPEYKNYNQKVDIITGQIRDTNQKNSGYERYTAANQHLQSGDRTVFPQDKFVHDPIGHRNIVARPSPIV